MAKPFVDWYEFLGIDETATEADIKVAFCRKKQELHPDNNPDDPRAAEVLEELRPALVVLFHPTLREELDLRRERWKRVEACREICNSKRKELQDALERCKDEEARFHREDRRTPIVFHAADRRRLRDKWDSFAEKRPQERSAAAVKTPEEQGLAAAGGGGTRE